MLMVTTVNSLVISICTITCLLLLHIIKMFIWSKPPAFKLVRPGISFNDMTTFHIDGFCVNQVIHEIQVMMNTGLQVILDSVYKYTHLSVDCLQIQSLFFPEFGKLTPVSFFPVSRFFSHLHDLDSKRVCFWTFCFFLVFLGFGCDHCSACGHTNVVWTLQLCGHLPQHRADEDRHRDYHWICKCLRRSPASPCLALWVRMKFNIGVCPSIKKLKYWTTFSGTSRTGRTAGWYPSPYLPSSPTPSSTWQSIPMSVRC